ncbi:MAG: hypothetical protein ABSF40_02680 [Candidatus Acidiferrales bacterium]
MHSLLGQFSAFIRGVAALALFAPLGHEPLADCGERKDWDPVLSETEVAVAFQGQTCIEKLAQLFTGISPVRIPVRVLTTGIGRKRLQEQTVIEFGTAHEVLFSSVLPLEFEDRVRMLNSDGSLDAWATVVAVRYHDGRKAVAARFVGHIDNWIIKP